MRGELNTQIPAARLMQRSVQLYKGLGGRYRGPRDPNNSLV